MSFLRPDSEFMNAVSRCADYVILNLLCLVCCLPLITIGASMTAKYSVSMKIVRGEEPVVTKAFFTAFSRNFRQATLVWAILAPALVLLIFDWYLVTKGENAEFHLIYILLLFVFSFFAAGVFFCVFPLLARFYIRTGEALRGALLFTAIRLPHIFAALALTAAVYIAGFWYLEWLPLIWALGTGVLLYGSSRLFVREFEKIENR